MPYTSLLHPEPLPLWQSTADPYLHRRCLTTFLSPSLWGLWVLVHTRFVWALRASLVGMGFDSKYDFDPPIILLGLLLWPPHQNLFIIWVILAVPWDMRVLPKSWLSVQQWWIEIWNQSFGGKRKCSFVSLPGKREHSRLPPQELLPSGASSEEFYGQGA